MGRRPQPRAPRRERARGDREGGGVSRVTVVGGGLAGIAAALDCADARRVGHAARVPRPARRRRLLVHARRASRRQRPARVPALLHRVPRAARADRRRATASRSSRGSRSRCSRPGGRPARLRRSGCRRRCTSRARCSRYPFLERRASALGVARAMQRAAARSTPTIRRPTRARSATGWPSTARARGAIDAIWEPDRPPDAEPGAGATRRSRRPRRCSRSGLLRDRRAGDIGYARVPLSEIHDAPARARAARAPASRSACGAARPRIVAGRRRRFRVELSGAPTVARRRGDRRRSSPTGSRGSLPPRGRHRPRRAGAARHARRSSTCTSSTTAACSSMPFAAGRRHARCSGCSTAPTAPGSSAGSTWRSRCRPPTPSCEMTVDELRERYLPALAELLPGRARRRGRARSS